MAKHNKKRYLCSSMSSKPMEHTEQIVAKALELGFDACGVSSAEFVGEVATYFEEWLQVSKHGEMGYLARNSELRYNPALLMENAKSVVSLALNYYPERKQSADAPQFAYYAYGKDYHEVMKAKIGELLTFIQTIFPQANGRCFVDSAPMMESYWAMRSGIGYKGKNTLLIIPNKGSYFFLGEILLDVALSPTPSKYAQKSLCGSCRKCIDACPTGALCDGYTLDARKCISYQTIENKDDKINPNLAKKLSGRVYGCDICQQVCPWNRKAVPHRIPEFQPSEAFLELTLDGLQNLTEEQFRTIFKGSAVKRAKYAGLMRNVQALLDE